MAIAFPDAWMWRKLRKNGFIPNGQSVDGPTVLEIGQANWYGDVALAEVHDALKDSIRHTERQRREMLEFLNRVYTERNHYWEFAVARLYLHAYLGYSRIDAIDMHGPPGCLPLDLNRPIPPDAPLLEKYDVVINTGTVEHIFDVAQALRTIHERTFALGLSYHCFPLNGCMDHGFWTVNPCMVEDLCKANGYQVLAACVASLSQRVLFDVSGSIAGGCHQVRLDGKLPPDCWLYVALQHTSLEPFRVPQQGVYAPDPPAELVERWRSTRG